MNINLDGILDKPINYQALNALLEGLIKRGYTNETWNITHTDDHAWIYAAMFPTEMLGFVVVKDPTYGFNVYQCGQCTECKRFRPADDFDKQDGCTHPAYKDDDLWCDTCFDEHFPDRHL